PPAPLEADHTLGGGHRPAAGGRRGGPRLGRAGGPVGGRAVAGGHLPPRGSAERLGRGPRRGGGGGAVRRGAGLVRRGGRLLAGRPRPGQRWRRWGGVGDRRGGGAGGAVDRPAVPVRDGRGFTPGAGCYDGGGRSRGGQRRWPRRTRSTSSSAASAPGT